MAQEDFLVSLRQSGNNMVVHVKNRTGKECQVLKWKTVLDFPYVHGFDVKVNNNSLEYTGPLFKRVFDPQVSLVAFAPDQEIEIVYELSGILSWFSIDKIRTEDKVSIGLVFRSFEIYDEVKSLEENAPSFYEIPVESVMVDLDTSGITDAFKKKDREGEGGQTVSIDMSSVPICLAGHYDGYEEMGPTARNIVGFPVTVNLNQQQKQRINLIMKEIYNYVILTFRPVTNSSHYRRWFGTYTAENADHVNRTIRSVHRGACPSYMVFDGSRTSLCTGDTYAYIIPTPGYNENPKQCSSEQHYCHKVFICPLFWSRPLKGTDSQVGTFIHEFSHGYSYTKDHAYGKTKCLDLARKSPHLAIMNADNYEYFIEELLKENVERLEADAGTE